MSWIIRVPALSRQLRAGRPMAWLDRHIRREYLVMLFMSCPPWVQRADLKPLADLAIEKSRITGVKHVVDHVIPVTHHLVCGLTVPWNLRVTTSAQNSRKSNDLNAELFDQPEQLRIL